MKWKSLRFSKDGFGKVSIPKKRIILPIIKRTLPSMNFFSDDLVEEITEQLKKEREKKEEGKKFKNTLEEFSTKIGEDE